MTARRPTACGACPCKRCCWIDPHKGGPVSQLTGPEQKDLTDLLLGFLVTFDQLDRSLQHAGLGNLSDFARSDTLPAMTSQVISVLSLRYQVVEFVEAVLNGDVLRGICPPIENWLRQNRDEMARRKTAAPPPAARDTGPSQTDGPSVY